MRKKILLLGFYNKFGHDGISEKILRLGHITDRLFKSNSDEVMGIIKRGHYNAFIVYLINKAFLETAKLVRKEYNELPIIGILSNDKKDRADYSCFTSVVAQPINIDKLKEIL